MTEPNHNAIAVTARAIPERMHPMVAAAMAHSPDPATLRELLAVQREWEAGEQLKSFTTALIALKGELPTVLAHDSTVDYQGAKGRVYYTHTSLAAVMDAVTEPLTRYGFSLSWKPGTTERGAVEVTCKLTHVDGHTETCTLSAPADNSGGKNPGQAIASTITLLERYTACAVLGIATRDMSEPTNEPAPDVIDTARNMKAAAWLPSIGRSRAEGEKYLGKKVEAWTAADLTKLKAWGPPDRQPGDN